MKPLLAFIKKETTEQIRSGKLMLLGIIFILFGIMNPAIAKLTPWLLDLMADSLADIGMNVTVVTVSAMDSWVQFFKNMPMGLIAFVLIESNIFTKEYASGSLVLSLTKGLERFHVVIAKTVILAVLWSLCFWLCFGITYVYNDYFWDNSIAQSLMFSMLCQWLFGIFVISLAVLSSTLFLSNTGVLVGTGGVVFLSTLVGMIPKAGKYLPTYLTDGNSLIYGVEEAEAYLPALLITSVATLICLAVSVPIFNKKQL